MHMEHVAVLSVELSSVKYIAKLLTFQGAPAKATLLEITSSSAALKTVVVVVAQLLFLSGKEEAISGKRKIAILCGWN